VTVTADPATTTKTRTAPPIPPPAHRLPWRSPADQPVWARSALLTLAVLAGSIYATGIRDGLVHGYYAPAVKSMLDRCKAFPNAAARVRHGLPTGEAPENDGDRLEPKPADSRMAARPAPAFSRNAVRLCVPA
jgi:hypothetical protein